eukprot:SAG31_NODE_9452_length_1275_cov_0.869048_1_plen_128_part_10
MYSAQRTAAQVPVDCELEKLQQEIAPLKMRQLKQMALDAGIAQARVDDVDDTDDPKAAVHSLILSAHRAKLEAGNRRTCCNEWDEETMTGALQGGEKDAVELVASVLEQTLELLELRLSSATRKERKT